MSEINAPPTSETITTLAKETAEKVMNYFGTPLAEGWRNDAASIIASALASVAQSNAEEGARVLLQHTNYHHAECKRLRAELAQVKTESESRRQTLLTVREQQVSDWKRAEKAEAELAQAQAALNLIADPPGSAQGICECEHDTGDCCAETSYHCPQCIAAKALRLRDLPPVSERSE